VTHSPAAVAIVGAGAVAQTLGRLLVTAGEPVAVVASRSRAHAEQAAAFMNKAAQSGSSAEPVRAVDISDVPRIAPLVLIAVADQGIEPIAAALAASGMRSGVALHTCGAKGPSALEPLGAAGVACGLLHPLQTIMAPGPDVRSLADVTFGLVGDRAAVEWGEQVIAALGGRSLHIDAARLSYYHAGAVMASNALIAALDAAVVLFAAAGVDRDRALRAIAPLARTSVDNALDRGPQAALTGPVSRGDAATVAAHIRALQHVDPTVARLYETAAAHLLQLAKQRGLAEASVRAVEGVLK
jgi:predicted short-subunit dehydrogenase-like oxidoreductase (DUF2520 family)